MATLVKVSSQSRTQSVAGAIAGIMRESDCVEVQAIGAPAINQAVKAMAVARGYLMQDNIDLVVVPSFHDVDIDGQERTSIRFTVFHMPAAPAAPDAALAAD